MSVASSLSLLLGCGGTTNAPNDSGSADHSQGGGDGGGGRKGPDASGSETGALEGGKPEAGSMDGGSDGGADASDSGPPMPTEWTVVSTPLDGGVGYYGVGGITTSDVWAVGGTSSTPADIFWAGASWAYIGLVITTSPMLSVSTSSEGVDDSWSVAGDAVLHWDGTGWSPLTMESNTMPLASIFAAAPGHAFAVGSAGTVLDCEFGTSACTASTEGTADLTSVWGLDASTLWAVGKSGVIYGYDGTSWTAQTGSGTADLYSVWGSDEIDIWAVGNAIEHSDGSTWTKNSYVPSGTLYGVWASAPNEAWAVGTGGVILAWDGTSWKSTTSPTTNDLYGIWGSDVHDMWAVGAHNTVLHRLK
jgi:hypothetical protein